jgi:hypothetical protein
MFCSQYIQMLFFSCINTTLSALFIMFMYLEQQWKYVFLYDCQELINNSKLNYWKKCLDFVLW